MNSWTIPKKTAILELFPQNKVDWVLVTYETTIKVWIVIKTVCSPLVTAPILRRCTDDTTDSYSGLFWTLTLNYLLLQTINKTR